MFFGATMEYAESDGATASVTLVGVDEVDLEWDRVSWISPVARALLKARVGDTVKLLTPVGTKQLDVLAVRYPTTSP